MKAEFTGMLILPGIYNVRRLVRLSVYLSVAVFLGCRTQKLRAESWMSRKKERRER